MSLSYDPKPIQATILYRKSTKEKVSKYKFTCSDHDIIIALVNKFHNEFPRCILIGIQLEYLEERKVKCPKCGKLLTLKQDGTVPKHKLTRPPWGSSTPMDYCPTSETRQEDWKYKPEEWKGITRKVLKQ
jgi:hypothetical protein